MPENHHDDDQTQSFVPLTKGTEIGHYKIVSKIGAGGMGEVYLAEDAGLNRKVALKFLPAHIAGNADMRARFTREAQAAAKLDHPNIVPVYEVDEYQGRPYFAMAHIEGKSLREVIKEGKLGTDDAVHLTMQILEGLHEAHDTGIIHRDIKPGNIIIDNKGRPRLVDFGLAMVSGEDKLTKTGSTLGTVGYMSPEQVEGKTCDLRSDLFSVGVILYEMLTGRRPFEGDNEAAIARAITDSSPEPVARFKSGTTGELQQIIDRALSKDPSLRYQHADGMLADLKRLQLGTPYPKKRKLSLWIVAIVILVFAMAYFIIDRYQISTKTDGGGWDNSVAVMVFRNLSGDEEQDIFCEGMTEDIINRLTTIKRLKVPGTQSMLRFVDANLELKEIGKQLEVNHILAGSIRQSGDSIRVSAQLIRLEDDASIWAENYDKDMRLSSIFAIQDDVSRSISDVLKATLVGNEPSFVARRGTNNIEAYKAYIRGRHFWRKRTEEGMKSAITQFETAVALDHEYAAGWCGLSDGWSMLARYSYLNQLTGYTKADTFSLKALELDPNLVEAHASRGWALYLQGEFAEAEQHFIKAIELNPGYVWSHQWYGNLLRDLGRHEEFLTQLDIAYQLDPLCPSVLHTMALESRRSGDLAKAKELYETILDIEPYHPESFIGLCQTYLSANDTAKALEMTDMMIQQLPDNWKSYNNKGQILAQLGRFDEAREAYEKSIEVAPDVWRTHSLYGWFLDTYKFFDEAAEQFRLAMKLDTSQFDGYLGYAWVLRRMGRSSEAGVYQKRAVELGPYSARTHRHYGLYLENVVGDIKEAIKYYTRAVELNPRYSWGYQSLADAYSKMGNYNEALNAIDKAIEISPTESYFVLARGGYHAEAGKLDSAVTAYKSYLDLPEIPNYLFVQMRIADIYVVLGEFSQADSIYSLYLNDPDSIQRGYARSEAVNPLLYQGKFTEALQRLQEAIEVDQSMLGNSDPLWGKYDRRGWIFLRYLNAPDSALAQFRQAEKVLETLPSSTRILLAWNKSAQAVALAAMGDVHKAMQILKESLERVAPTETDLRRIYNYNLAIIYRLTGEFDKSASLMENIQGEEPDFDNQYCLGISYLRLNRMNDALKVFERAMSVYDDARFNSWGESVLCHYYLGQAYEAAGRTSDAIKQYETFLDIWKNADEGLESVKDAKKRLANLKDMI